MVQFIRQFAKQAVRDQGVDAPGSGIRLFQQGGIDGIARSLVEQPAMALMQQAGMILQTRVAPEKREALAKEIQADVRKYV